MKKRKKKGKKLQEDIVIDIRNVCMHFKVAEEGAESLKEFLIRTITRKNKHHLLEALDDISFQVKRGEIVGIIGRNGAGKSTLLKIISGALRPTRGTVVVDRNKLQLLTLGTGFDFELTAKENVYLNGAIIGYSKEYLDANYDKIVEFAELDGFMGEKVKNFSSGMISRLGFAIATVQNAAEILILDEVLSVGDLHFREKSLKRIQEMIYGGATVLIVSHSLDVIVKHCTRVLWLEKGKLVRAGNAKEVCAEYKSMER